MLDEQPVNEKEEDDELLKTALKEHSRKGEEIPARDFQPCFNMCESIA